MSEKITPKKVSLLTALTSIGILVVVSVLASLIIVYAFSRSSLSMKLRHSIPYPAVLVSDASNIAFKDIDIDLASIRRFYESQSDELSQAGLRVDFTTPEGQKRLMVREKELINKLVEDKAILHLAQMRGIEITQDKAQSELQAKMKEFGNDPAEVTKKLQKLYGWESIADFQNKVIMPSMYRDALSQKYTDGTDISDVAKKRIVEAQSKLKAGESFETIAAEYSDGQTAKSGGELGFIPVSSITPEIRQFAQSGKLQQVSEVIESPLGFHIVAVEERSQEKDQIIVRLKQIFTKKLSFSDWLTEQMKSMDITVLYKGYSWNKDTARIEFNQPEMQSFEANLLNTSEGDASVLF